MLLFFDTETSGLPRNWKAPVTDLDNWPRVLQIAWLLYAADATLQSQGNLLIQPVDVIISPEASRIHGITQEKAMAEGVPLAEALQQFDQDLAQANTLVAHNIQFDLNVWGAEYLRVQGHNPLPDKETLCTQDAGTPLCKFPGRYGYKWPKLAELHQFLFREGIAGAHDAAIDIQATARCFWEMRKRGVI